MQKTGKDIPGLQETSVPEVVNHAVSLTLYLCSERADIHGHDGISPARPAPVKTKKGLKYFPPKKPTVFDSGYRLGEFLRRQKLVSGPGGGTHASPSPHVRAAHWHTFLTGPRYDPENRRRVVKWLPPVPVGFKWEDIEGEVVPTVKRVKSH